MKRKRVETMNRTETTIAEPQLEGFGEIEGFERWKEDVEEEDEPEESVEEVNTSPRAEGKRRKRGHRQRRRASAILLK